MTKPEPHVSTRDRILQAAILEIAERGIGGIRSRGVAERAGVNNALVHYHFKTMDDLVAEATATAFAALSEPAVASLSTPTVGEGFDLMAEMISSVDPTDPTWALLLEVMVHAPRHPRLGGFVMGWLRDYRTAMQQRLERAVEEGELPADTDTAGLSLALMALLDGLGLYAYVAPDLDVRRAATSFTQLISRSTQGETP
jgi:AcrR family transcriptional regulator